MRPRWCSAGFFCVMLALHAVMPVDLGDDLMYRDMLQRMSLWEFLTDHYATWSARSLVEAVLCTVAALPPVVWRVADALLVALCAFLAARTAGAEQSVCGAAVAALCFLCYDWTALSTAGWMCTTLVFVWPLAAALAAAQPLVQLCARAAPGRARCVRQVCLCWPMLPTWSKCWWCTQGCLAGMLLWHAAAPPRALARLGSACRMCGQRAVCSYLPWYGLAHCRRDDFLVYRFRYAHCVAERRAWHFKRHVPCAVSEKHFVLRVLHGAGTGCGSAAPRMAGAPVRRAACGGGGRAGRGCPPGGKAGAQPLFFANVFTKDGYLNLLTVYSPKYWLAFVVLCAVLAICVLNLYLALGHTRTAFGAMVLFCAGFASYAMLGFSPTVMVSGQRTGFFLFDVGAYMYAAFCGAPWLPRGQNVPAGYFWPCAPCARCGRRPALWLYWRSSGHEAAEGGMTQ